MLVNSRSPVAIVLSSNGNRLVCTEPQNSTRPMAAGPRRNYHKPLKRNILRKCDTGVVAGSGLRQRAERLLPRSTPPCKGNHQFYVDKRSEVAASLVGALIPRSFAGCITGSSVECAPRDSPRHEYNLGTPRHSYKGDYRRSGEFQMIGNRQTKTQFADGIPSWPFIGQSSEAGSCSSAFDCVSVSNCSTRGVICSA